MSTIALILVFLGALSFLASLNASPPHSHNYFMSGCFLLAPGGVGILVQIAQTLQAILEKMH